MDKLKYWTSRGISKLLTEQLFEKARTKIVVTDHVGWPLRWCLTNTAVVAAAAVSPDMLGDLLQIVYDTESNQTVSDFNERIEIP